MPGQQAGSGWCLGVQVDFGAIWIDNISAGGVCRLQQVETQGSLDVPAAAQGASSTSAQMRKSGVARVISLRRFPASTMIACLVALSSVQAAGNRLGLASTPLPYQGPSETLTVPAETEASVVLLSGIHTKIGQVDDPVQGQLVGPVYVNGQLALPAGTLLYGRVTRSRAAGRLRRPAELGLRFDEISLPDGETEPVTARLAAIEQPEGLRLDQEGYLKAGRRFSWHFITGSLLGAGALVAIPKIAGAGAAATAGSIAAAGFLGAYVLLPHGREIHLPPDTRCRIRFDYAFSVHAQS